MINIEDVNNERYHINPKQVVYVKERMHNGVAQYKILLSCGEAVITTNEHGAKCIIASIKSKKQLCEQA